MMRLDELTKPIEQMNKEELENYILNTVQSVKEDFNDAKIRAMNEQNRTRD